MESQASTVKGPRLAGTYDRFPDTSWTLLSNARKQCAEGVRAREVFARRYQRPVQEFLLTLLRDPEKAEELSQEFFTRLSGPGKLLERANPEKGTFHGFLKQALRNLATDYHRRNRKEALLTHPDQATAEAWEFLEMHDPSGADAAFHRAWVEVTLAEALTRVRALCRKRRQEVHLELFEARYLSETDFVPSWDELGASHGMDEKAARDRAETVARHFRFVLRRMLRSELTADGGCGHVTEEVINKEIKALLSPLRD